MAAASTRRHTSRKLSRLTARSTSSSTFIPGKTWKARSQEFAYYSDEPSADAGALPVWFLSKLCKARTTVALSGEGADELFGGYLTYRANSFANILRKFPRPALQAALSALCGAGRYPTRRLAWSTS